MPRAVTSANIKVAIRNSARLIFVNLVCANPGNNVEGLLLSSNAEAVPSLSTLSVERVWRYEPSEEGNVLHRQPASSDRSILVEFLPFHSLRKATAGSTRDARMRLIPVLWNT